VISRSELRRATAGALLSLVAALLSVLVSTSMAAAAGDANMTGCPNEAMAGFREYLPDCRAYEMVTPPFKDGGGPVIGLEAVSDDGSHVLAHSLGAYAGTESDAASGARYEFSRLGSGWVTSAISPPASLFSFNESLAASSELQTTLWATRAASQSIYAKDLYVREPDGTFVKVGPMVPPSAEAGPPAGSYQDFLAGYVYAGASRDLSHVLFEIRPAEGQLWPGDTTRNESSLYEYLGRENKQPKLVGVNAEGHLISDCGTVLGTLGLNSPDTYNASSANGETVFFTALPATEGEEGKHCNSASEGTGPAVSELYARLDRSETVAVSEPAHSQCLESICNTAVKAPAEFQGASEDGSKVFFLTEQELFYGDTTKNLYEYDFANPAGHKIVRVSVGSPTPEVLGVARVSEDGSHVYFVAKGKLTSEPRGGGCLTKLSPSELTEEELTQEGRCRPKKEADNLYVFERDAAHPGGRLAFVATLSEADNEDWLALPGHAHPVQATPDGRFLVFGGVADLTPGDTSMQPQVFEYDALEQKLIRVSVGQAGYASGSTSADAHGSVIPNQPYNESQKPTTAETDLAVSADGSHVVFSSAGALTPAAEAAAAARAESVYEYRSVGSIANGNVYLISDGTNALSASAIGLDASGSDVFFETADPLLAQDVDTQFDLYDARVGGGFPAPAAPAGCEGEGCQGALSATPSFGAPGSVSVSGGANVPPPPPPGPVVKPKAKPLTRAQKLAKALKACRAKHNKHRRAVCEAQARKTYASKSSVNGKGKR
jgi:hypothetical protein